MWPLSIVICVGEGIFWGMRVRVQVYVVKDLFGRDMLGSILYEEVLYKWYL